MCLILTSWQSHPHYPLVVLANRDEFYERPTDPMHWWEEHPHILAGRDRADVNGSSGTWMGITKSGRFAALTNVRAPTEKNSDSRTRGEIAADFLKGRQSPEDFINDSERKFQRYNGFNFLSVDLSLENPGLHWLSNRVLMGDKLRPRKVMNPQCLTPGVYGLSNAMLDTPWPKVQHRVGAFAQMLAMDTGDFKKSEQYMRIMQDQTPAPDEYLPQTGLSYEWEKALSSAFIKTEHYGTRSIALIRVRHDGQFEVIEKRFDAEKELDTQTFDGQLENFQSTQR
ncbi:NRDE family protein [Polynucleobacter sp. 30F-ANTBAC]|uniref:NRDE family protein n=1 Tax=Polynucleobacter sp. 30F-ANTBAC TaxID=2689095 RepID=UPI001C0BC79C|nr:NRDE family protein [Polynucleobacter sp. 30F-ANTBAC]MBU3599101.1 NRDE family protein [Polynucleobacter sp. 30F-ANTBAC]